MTRRLTTRFTPDPIEYLHMGDLRTASHSYSYARKNKDNFLLHIEDTDLERDSKEATQAIIEAFKWCGLDYDDEVTYQSERFDLCKKYIRELLDEGRAYYCYINKEELDELRAKQEAAKKRPKYDGRYRDFTGTPPSNIEPVARVKAPQKGEICFIDDVRGEVRFKVGDILNDFIIAKSDGSPTYNFTAVVDDASMGMSDVIRGNDHLSNTPRQIVLYEALGFEIPKLYHVATIYGEGGKKLSKRYGATDVMEYKAMGALPQALLNFLTRLGWGHGDDEVFSLEDLRRLFGPNHTNKSTSYYNSKKLEWLNAHYTKTLPFEEINRQSRDLGFDLGVYTKIGLLLDLLGEHTKALLEIINGAKSIVEAPQDYDESTVNKFINESSLLLLQNYANELNEEKGTKDFGESTNEFLRRNGVKLKDLAQPIRIALTGSVVSPSIFEALEFLGANECKKRIKEFLGLRGK